MVVQRLDTPPEPLQRCGRGPPTELLPITLNEAEESFENSVSLAQGEEDALGVYRVADRVQRSIVWERLRSYLAAARAVNVEMGHAG